MATSDPALQARLLALQRRAGVSMVASSPAENARSAHNMAGVSNRGLLNLEHCGLGLPWTLLVQAQPVVPAVSCLNTHIQALPECTACMWH